MEDQTQTTAAEAPSLSLQDLVLLLNLVRVTAERGAIKADEMTAVGTVYEKLFRFLQASGAIAQTPPQTTTSLSEESKAE